MKGSMRKTRVPEEKYRERFMTKVRIESNTGCWLWMGNVDPEGYGYFPMGYTAVRAHRKSFALATGTQVPPHLHVDHKCCVRSCVNPAHLRIATPKENV